MHTFQLDFHAGRPKAIPTFRCRVVETPRKTEERFVEALEPIPSPRKPGPPLMRAYVEAGDAKTALDSVLATFENVALVDGPAEVALRPYDVTFAGTEPRYQPRFPLRCVGTLLDQVMPLPVMRATVPATTPEEALAWVRQVFDSVTHYRTVLAEVPRWTGAKTYDVTFQAGDPLEAPSFPCYPLPILQEGAGRALRACVPADDVEGARRALGATFADLAIVSGPNEVTLRWYRVVFHGSEEIYPPPYRCRRIVGKQRRTTLEAAIEAADADDAAARASLPFRIFELEHVEQDDHATSATHWW